MPNDTPANVSGTGEETQETPHTGGEEMRTRTHAREEAHNGTFLNDYHVQMHK